jgi:hypothetical protein
MGYESQPLPIVASAPPHGVTIFEPSSALPIFRASD